QWCRHNEWKGAKSDDRRNWKYQWYGEGQDFVLFGDWQICFQTYIDLYDMGIDGASVDRVYEVIDYQISKDEDSFWWWADSLYMVMPVFTKLYKQTNDEKYLDALYKYFKYAKELMYDGPGGIPESADGYTTSAALNSGASYSDPDNYAYLFFRDAGYVYPLNPNTGHEDEKNFWARGDGWVFAGLSKVLSDMPNTYEHYGEFYTTYVEMAGAIIACQQVDEAGYGFWTQSMLQDYPKGSNGNDEGYETSGTAFFTYGLFWGINNGILTDAEYTTAAIRAWGYLENVALHSDGKVGYVQPIGSNATQAVSYDTTANFGVGAYLLACCEAARWAQAQ
ncbi:MAG: glycoside hydrolase family 88 protein, partial [Clostridia bacterium]|nr:glycoside hydrolase family 88 protein [Clostridia bacterium]